MAGIEQPGERNAHAEREPAEAAPEQTQGHGDTGQREAQPSEPEPGDAIEPRDVTGDAAAGVAAAQRAGERAANEAAEMIVEEDEVVTHQAPTWRLFAVSSVLAVVLVCSAGWAGYRLALNRLSPKAVPALSQSMDRQGRAAQDERAASGWQGVSPEATSRASEYTDPEAGSAAASHAPSRSAADESPRTRGPERAIPDLEALALPPGVRAQVAIVIDDWGYDWSAAQEMLQVHPGLTVAVLPNLPFSRRHAEEAKALGHEVILHLPMQAEGDAPADGKITVHMSDAEIAAQVQRNMAAVPGITGVNNHMGSKATADPRVMRQVLQAIDDANLYFLDSRTTAQTAVPAVARELGLPYLGNSLFLDNEDNETYVRNQLRQLARIALSRGEAVGIGHVRAATARALAAELPRFAEQGIELVPLSRLYQRAYAANLSRKGGRGEPRVARAEPIAAPAPNVAATPEIAAKHPVVTGEPHTLEKTEARPESKPLPELDARSEPEGDEIGQAVDL